MFTKILKDSIYLGITTTERSNWRDKMREVNEFKIKKVALFPTVLDQKERQELYKLVEKSSIEEIPLVHARDDFTAEEFEYFLKNYKTRAFNIHENHFQNTKEWLPFRHQIYLEYNHNNKISNKVDVGEIAGLCVDFSHFYAAKNDGDKECAATLKWAAEKGVGCNHLNGYNLEDGDKHFIDNESDLNYLKNIPENLFSDIIGLEMENTLEEQLEYKEYILKILS